MGEISREATTEHLKNARVKVYDAINEMLQSGMGGKLSRYVNDLRRVEDVLWQLTTPEKPVRAGGRK